MGKTEFTVLAFVLLLGMMLPWGPGTLLVWMVKENEDTVRALQILTTVSTMGTLLVGLWRKSMLFTVMPVVTVLTSAGAPLLVTSYLAGLTYRRPAHLAIYTVAASAVAMLPEVLGAALGLPRRGWSQLPAATGGIALFVLLPLVVGLLIETRRQVVAGLRKQAAQERLQHTTQVREVRARERSRIAQEMHDVVAHRVSLMVLHAGVLEVNTKEKKTAETAALIRTTGREALSQLREVLGVLRTSEVAGTTTQPPSTLAEIGELVDDSRAAGIPVRWRDDTVLPSVSPMVAQTAYQVVREALTNVHKHAGAVETEVELRSVGHALEVKVHNAAPAERPEPLPGNGLGLLGLRERVELVGGIFHSSSCDRGGWLVTARLPYAEQVRR
ncbi:hypothetical protein A4R43_03890 [Amycolatopsis albispora]|uniref:histidine kinase n=2 Tax=Amycolatopsis albispora TaxID=1804986 RepID=A0A344L146_9PSEU|nr:hypothetical protein A4R43_03890 [Amycolatopsis albispora]